MQSVPSNQLPFNAASSTRRPIFKLGQVVATPGALSLLATAGVEPIRLLERHVTGDWSEMNLEDQRSNILALAHSARILSAYQVGQAKVWVITEADRASTCILLPSEY